MKYDRPRFQISNTQTNVRVHHFKGKRNTICATTTTAPSSPPTNRQYHEIKCKRRKGEKQNRMEERKRIKLQCAILEGTEIVIRVFYHLLLFHIRSKSGPVSISFTLFSIVFTNHLFLFLCHTKCVVNYVHRKRFCLKSICKTDFSRKKRNEQHQHKHLFQKWHKKPFQMFWQKFLDLWDMLAQAACFYVYKCMCSYTVYVWVR